MKRFIVVLNLLLVAAALPGLAQDEALDLPAALYVLTNEGVVQRYGRGTEGVTTVTPEGVFVLDFGVSPDDKWLAYRTEAAFTLLNRENGAAVQLSAGENDFVPSVRGAGDTIVWSPAGDALAAATLYGGRVYFSADSRLLTTQEGTTSIDLYEGPFVQLVWSPSGRFMAAEVEGNVWWIYRRERNSMILTSVITSSVGIAWVSDSEVIFTPAEGGLILMDLNRGNQQTVLLDRSSIYGMPQALPNGVVVVFDREPGAEAESGSARLLRLTVSSKAVEPVNDNLIDVQGLRWVPWGELMTSFREGVFGLFLPTTGERFVLPISGAISYSWGPVIAEEQGG